MAREVPPNFGKSGKVRENSHIQLRGRTKQGGEVGTG